MENNLSVEDRVVLVRAAIGRIKQAEQEWRDAESNPSCGISGRAATKIAKNAAEAEFAWQWKNVEIILEGKK